jgi:hypothetical protein
MSAYNNAAIELNHFISKKKALRDAPVALDDNTRLSQLFEQLLNEIRFRQNDGDKKDDLFQKTAAIIRIMNCEPNEPLTQDPKTALNDFRVAFSIDGLKSTEKLLAIAATVVCVIASTLYGLLFGILSLGIMPSVCFEEGVKEALYAPFQAAYFGGTLGYHFAEDVVLGTPRALINKVKNIGRKNFGLFDQSYCHKKQDLLLEASVTNSNVL